MTIEELKQEIAQRSGIPVSFLTGETTDEIIAKAKALLAYKKQGEEQRPRSAEEQFSDWWLYGRHGAEAPDEASRTLAEIEEAARDTDSSYPKIADSGEADTEKQRDPRPTAAQFAEWFYAKLPNPYDGRW